MDNYKTISDLISSFSGQERYFTVPRVYVELVSDFSTAILLNQIIFWSDKSSRKDGYFYKSYIEWEEETTLTEYQVRRSSKVLKEMGFIDTILKRANGSPTLHYNVNMENVSESILNKLKNRNLTNLRIDTEETQESITVDDTVDDNIKKEISPKLKEPRKRYGEYNHVLLTEQQKEKLITDFGKQTVDEYIKRVDEYCQQYTKKYGDYNLTIRKWLGKEKPQTKPVEFLNLAEDDNE